MRESQRPQIEDGRKRYGTSVSNAAEKGDEIFVPASHIPREAEAGFKTTHQGHTVKLKEKDSQSGTPGWWAEIVNSASDMCTCGDTSGEHEYGTGKCLSCSNCQMFKRKMENEIPANHVSNLKDRRADGQQRYGKKV